MTRPGAKTLPTSLKLLRGERRAQRLNLDEPTPAGGDPAMPEDMDPVAQRVWRDVVAALAGTDVLTAADGGVLRLYCEAFARYLGAQDMLVRSGPVLTGRGGIVGNPLGRVVRNEAQIAMRLQAELGLTPSSRAGLRTAAPKSDAFEEYLSRGRRRTSA
jgi:P27 family predicted phage terminase small subunit